MRAALQRAVASVGRRSPWAVAAAALLVGILFAIPNLQNRDFSVALVATYIGAALGFFVALAVDRLQRREDEEARRVAAAEAAEAKRAREANVARTRRTTMLSLLREELGRVVGQMGTNERQSRTTAPFDRMTDLLWRALSSSGELRWIEDLALLREVASAYDLLAAEIDLEHRWLEARAVAGTGIAASEDFIRNQLRLIDHDLWRGACSACKAMDAALTADGAAPGAGLFCP